MTSGRGGKVKADQKSALILGPIPMAHSDRLPSQFLPCFVASPMTGTVTVLQKGNRWSDLLRGFEKVAEILPEQRSISKR